MAILRDLVVDCHHPAALARFWTAALDGYQVAAYDEEAMADLAAQGIADPEEDPSVLVEPVAGTGLRLFFNLVPEDKASKNRLHIDVTAENPGAERERLIGLGARALRRDPDGWVVMADPEGNEFCLMD
ncbi:MAG TPA: VOC family protein [Candidatus Ruania gallistercoris]|uniref:VOC family protein n=1 Tax=Candidatus Ruania gallistercoris TaxID=2838746 RepID=A0A9D2EDL0_9MICO|nr:VOC family protein [Candidatus Ruania gallistercoris]